LGITIETLGFLSKRSAVQPHVQLAQPELATTVTEVGDGVGDLSCGCAYVVDQLVTT